MSFSHMGIDNFPYDPELHDVQLLVGAPEAIAFAWLLAYAQNLTDRCSNEEYSNAEISVADLVSVADSHQPENDSTGWGGDYIVRGGAFEGFGVDPTFWKMYAQFRGKTIDEVEQAHFFSCSC